VNKGMRKGRGVAPRPFGYLTSNSYLLLAIIGSLEQPP
jgi:hypothetical protein